MADAPPPAPLRVEVLDKMSALITAALGLVAALAWNDAIQTFFTQVFGAQGALAAKAGYALFVTVLSVLLVLWVGRALGRAKAAVGPRRAP